MISQYQKKLYNESIFGFVDDKLVIIKFFKPANLSSLKNIIDYDDPLFSRIEFVDVRFEVNRARLLVLDQSKLVFEAGNLILKLFLRLSETEKNCKFETIFLQLQLKFSEV